MPFNKPVPDEKYASVSKVVLVGAAASGKSALLNSIKGEAFSSTYKVTQGIDYGYTACTDEEKQTHKFEIWDAAELGCERAISGAYFRGAQILVFTLAADQLFDKEQWARQKESIKEKSRELGRLVPAAAKQILVVTKKDLLTEQPGYSAAGYQKRMRALMQELEDDDCPIAAWADTSAKTRQFGILERVLVESAKKIEKEAPQPQGESKEVESARKVEAEIKRKFVLAIQLIEKEEKIEDEDGEDDEDKEEAQPERRVLQVRETQESGTRFLTELRRLQAQTLNDFRASKLSEPAARQLARSALQLTRKVANLTITVAEVNKFLAQTTPYIKPSRLRQSLYILAGAAIGVIIGALVGLAVGGLPGAALMALQGGYKGAVAGAAVGGLVLGGSTWCSFWQKRKNHPVMGLAREARAVMEQIPRPLVGLSS